MQRAQQLQLRGEQHIMALAHCGVADSLGDIALAGATGPCDEHGDFLLNLAPGDELMDLYRVNIRVEVEVKLVEGFVGKKGGSAQAGGKALVFSAYDLISDQ